MLHCRISRLKACLGYISAKFSYLSTCYKSRKNFDKHKNLTPPPQHRVPEFAGAYPLHCIQLSVLLHLSCNNFVKIAEIIAKYADIRACAFSCPITVNFLYPLTTTSRTHCSFPNPYSHFLTSTLISNRYTHFLVLSPIFMHLRHLSTISAHQNVSEHLHLFLKTHSPFSTILPIL